MHQLRTFALTFARLVTSQLLALHLLELQPWLLLIRPLAFQLRPLALTFGRLVTLELWILRLLPLRP